MKPALISMFLFLCVGRMQAETVRVIGGETGSAGRQIAVRECWIFLANSVLFHRCLMICRSAG